MSGSKVWNDCHVLRDDLSAWDLPALQQAGAQAGGMRATTTTSSH